MWTEEEMEHMAEDYEAGLFDDIFRKENEDVVLD